MTGDEVRKLDSEEIEVELKRLREKLFDLRQSTASEKVADNSRFRSLRRDVARLLTEQNARRRASAAG